MNRSTYWLGIGALVVVSLLATPAAWAEVATFAQYAFEGEAGNPALATDGSGNGRDYINSIGGNTYNADVRPGSAGVTSIQFANGGFYAMANITDGLLPTNNIGFEGWFKAANASENDVHIFGLVVGQPCDLSRSFDQPSQNGSALHDVRIVLDMDGRGYRVDQ